MFLYAYPFIILISLRSDHHDLMLNLIKRMVLWLQSVSSRGPECNIYIGSSDILEPNQIYQFSAVVQLVQKIGSFTRCKETVQYSTFASGDKATRQEGGVGGRLAPGAWQHKKCLCHPPWPMA
ncbi:hypothetical protein Ancab_017229, partial [Ancistrocladus abbreviatus]